jgi:hypothetical protein
MRIFLLLFGFFISSYANSNTALDAENEGEAVGIVYGHYKEIDVLKFMCGRKVPEQGLLVSKAADEWMTMNSLVLTNLSDGLGRTPIKDREELFEVVKTITNNRIILFNKLSQPEKEEMCLLLASRLNSDWYKKEYPLAYKLMSK